MRIYPCRYAFVITKLCLQPSQAFQIRFGGVKGVVYSAPYSVFEPYQNPSKITKNMLPSEIEKNTVKMLLRDSQIKFQPPDDNRLTLRIVSTNDDSHSCVFSALS